MRVVYCICFAINANDRKLLDDSVNVADCDLVAVFMLFRCYALIIPNRFAISRIIFIYFHFVLCWLKLPYSIKDSVLFLQVPSIIFGIAWPYALAIGVVFHVNSAPRFSAAFAFWQFISEDNTDSFHCSAIAFAIPW